MDNDTNQPLIIKEKTKKQQTSSLIQNQPNHYNNSIGQQPNQQNNQSNVPPKPLSQVQPQQQQIPTQFKNHPQANIIEQLFNLPCVMCGFNPGSYIRKTAGCAAFSWCICLFVFTTILCSWAPFCISSCLDIEIVCTRCGYIKGIIQAGCI